MKSMGEKRSDVRTVVCYPTYHCIMSTSPVIWVRLGGVHLDYVRIRSPLEYVDDLIHQVLVEYQQRIYSRFEGNMIGTDCIKVYFQGPNSNPEPGVEQVVKHDVKLSKVVGLNPCAYFRMEIVDPISPGTWCKNVIQFVNCRQISLHFFNPFLVHYLLL